MDDAARCARLHATSLVPSVVVVVLVDVDVGSTVVLWVRGEAVLEGEARPSAVSSQHPPTWLRASQEHSTRRQVLTHVATLLHRVDDIYIKIR